MMTRHEVKTATLDQLNEELGAAGVESNHRDIADAREAVLALIAEYAAITCGK